MSKWIKNWIPAIVAFIIGVVLMILIYLYVPGIRPAADQKSQTVQINLKEITSLIDSMVSLFALAGILWIVNVLRRLPGSEVSFKLPIGEGRVSIEDAGFMIKERLEGVSEDEVNILQRFKIENPSPDDFEDVDLRYLNTLYQHRLVEGDLDRKELRLSTWGYRVLKNVKGIATVPPWQRN